MMQDPWWSRDPVAKPAQPQAAQTPFWANDPVAQDPAPRQQQRPQSRATVPQPAQAAPPSQIAEPTISGLSLDESVQALMQQGYPADRALDMAREQERRDKLGSDAANPIPLDRVEPSELLARSPTGAWVVQPGGEPYFIGPYQIHRGAMRPGDVEYQRGQVLVRPQVDDATEQRRDMDPFARNVDAMLRGGVDAATLGFSDEIGSGLAAALSAARGQEGFGEGFERRQSRERAINEADAADAGGFRLTGQVLGGLVTPGTGAAGRFIQGAQGASRIARAGGVGAGYGAAYGLGGAEGNVAERAPEAVMGGLIGAGGGAVVQGGQNAVSAAAPRIMSGLSESGAVIARGLGREPADATITPQATERARLYARQLVSGSGADLTANATTKPITAAEVIGPRGVSNMAALVRRSGRTAQAAESQLGARARETPQRVIQDFADLTGMDPAGSADMIANLAASGRQRAAPLYQAAYERTVQPTPIIEDILRRPAGRRALRRAYELAREEGRNPEELGLFVMGADDGLRTGASAIKRDAELIEDLDALRAGTRTRGAARGPSLIEFLSKQGGVRDVGGDLQSVGASLWHKDGSWRSRLVRPDGVDLETAAQRAFDAGYFPELADATMEGAENMQRVSAQDMIDAIEDELRGVRRFAREPDARGDVANIRVGRRAALDERLQREGLDIGTVSNDDIIRRLRDADDADARIMAQMSGDGQDAPNVDLVAGEIPTFQTLDYVKRGLDDVLDTFRDKTTGRLRLDGRGRATLGSLTRFRRELERLNPAYRRALSAGGDPIRLEEAFAKSPQLFGLGVSERQFGTAIQRMGDAERRALIAGYANKLFEDAQAGRLTTRRMNEIDTPLTRTKLANLMGPEQADDFIGRIRQEVGMARAGGRMAPGTNSITSEVAQAVTEQDAGGGVAGNLARAIQQSGLIGGTMRATAEGLYAPIAGFVRGTQSPLNQAARDELGRILLMRPEEAAAALRAQGATTQDASRLAQILRNRPRGSTTGQSAGGLAQLLGQNPTQENRRAQQ